MRSVAGSPQALRSSYFVTHATLSNSDTGGGGEQWRLVGCSEPNCSGPLPLHGTTKPVIAVWWSGSSTKLGTVVGGMSRFTSHQYEGHSIEHNSIVGIA